MKNKNEEVQEASWSAAIELVACLDYEKSEWIQPVIQAYQNVIGYYKGNSLVTLLEMISLLAKTFKDDMYNDNAVEAVVTPLVSRWNEIVDNDKVNNLILRALIDIIGSVRDKINWQLSYIFGRCLRIVNSVHDSVTNEDNTQDFDVEFAVNSFALLTQLLKYWNEGLIPIVILFSWSNISNRLC